MRNSWFKGIMIEPNPRQFSPAECADFYNRTQRDLITISRARLGSELLELIRKRHMGIGTSGSGDQRIVIIKNRPVASSEGASTMAVQAGHRQNRAGSLGTRQIRFAGKGSKTYIAMHNNAGSEAIFTRMAGVPTPTWIALAHELIHAWHHLGGNTYGDSEQTAGGEVKREEMLTTGLGVYANTRLSENAIRREVGLPVRTYYSFADDHAAVGSLLAPRPGSGWLCSARLPPEVH